MKAVYLDLSPLVPWMERPRPYPWETEFGRSAPLELEIGFGNGEYLARYAKSHPELNLVGVEMTWGSIRRAMRKLAQSEASNARLLREDARVALHRIFAPQSLDRVYSLFPCPWPKKRHRKNRLFQTDFLRLVNSRLKEEGTLTVVTDHASYRDQMLEECEGSGFLCQVQTIGPEHNTKYERKWQEEGQLEFFQLEFQKVISVEFATPEEIPLEKLRAKNFDPERFQPEDLRGDLTVEFKEFLYDPHKKRGMVEVFAVEQGFTQHFWVDIRWSQSGWVIQPAPGCNVIPLRVVQVALEQVRRGF